MNKQRNDENDFNNGCVQQPQSFETRLLDDAQMPIAESFNCILSFSPKWWLPCFQEITHCQDDMHSETL